MSNRNVQRGYLDYESNGEYTEIDADTEPETDVSNSEFEDDDDQGFFVLIRLDQGSRTDYISGFYG